MSAAESFQEQLDATTTLVITAIEELSTFTPSNYSELVPRSPSFPPSPPGLYMNLGSSPGIGQFETFSPFNGTVPNPPTPPSIGSLSKTITRPPTPPTPQEPKFDPVGVSFSFPSYMPTPIAFTPVSVGAVPPAPQSTAPSVPTAPTGLSNVGVAPVPPSNIGNIDVPTLSMPALPASVDLTFGELSSLSNQLSATTGFMPNFTAYVALLPRGELISDISRGRTGIPTGVEEAIWNRHRERNLQSFDDICVASAKIMTKRGFIMPNGLAMCKTNEALNTYQNNKAEESREIAVEQAKLTQGNCQFAMDLLLKVEQAENSYNMERAKLEVAIRKDMQDAMIQVGNFYISTYNFKLKKYEIEVAIFSKKLEAEQVKTSIYSSQMEGEKLKISIYASQVDAFKTTLSAKEIEAKIYESQLSAYGLTLKQNEIKFRVFESQIAAFKAQTELEAVKGRVVESQANVEVGKAQIFKIQVEGEVAKATLQLEKAKLNLARQEVYLKQVASQLEQFRINSEDVKMQIQQNEMLNDIEKLTYTAKLDAHKMDTEAKFKAYEASLRTQEFSNESVKMSNESIGKQFDAQIETYKLNVATESKKIDVELIKYETQVKAQQSEIENSMKIALAGIESLKASDLVTADVKKAAAGLYKGVMDAYNSILVAAI